MSCPEQDTIEAYIHNQLSPYEKDLLETHLRDCHVCQERVKESHANVVQQGQLKHLQFETSDMLTNAPIEHVQHIDQAQQLLGDRYQFIQKIGQSATSIIFQATEKHPERQVAIKFLGREKSLAGTDSWDVARRVSQVDHPYIAKVYDIGQITQHRFIVMEWVEGRPLDQTWKDLGWEQRLCIFLKVLTAIQTAHHHNIIHRNIKPSNILLTSDMNPKVMDFGIATYIDPTAETPPHPTDTFTYLAPEQIINPMDITPATDIYALGVLLYQLLTNRLPFRKQDYNALCNAIRNDIPQFSSTQERHIPMAVQYICLKCLEKLPHNRYPDIQSLSNDIQRHLRGDMVWARPSIVSYTVQQDLFYHRQTLNLWRDNQLLAKTDYHRLIDVYDRMITPKDPTFMEATRLTLSQVCLYLGGWTILLGGVALFYKPWLDIPSWIRPLPVIAVTLVLTSLGLVLWYKRDTRLSIGFLIIANLLIPVTVALTLAQWNILSVDNSPWGYESLHYLLYDAGFAVTIGNAQLYMSTWLWLGSSVLFWRLSRSSIFFLLSIFPIIVLFTCHFMAAGLTSMPMDTVGGRYLLIGFILFVMGAAIDRLGHKGYAWPASIVGVLFIIGPLTLMSLSDDTLLEWYYDNAMLFTLAELRWLSVFLCGICYMVMYGLCYLLGTDLHRRLGNLFSWIGPLHIITALIILNTDGVDRTASHQNAYASLLLLISLIFIFTSAIRRKKIFFLAGLAGLAGATLQLTRTTFQESFAWPILLIITGIGMMSAAWLIPQWRAFRFLKTHEIKPKAPKKTEA